MKNCTVVSSSPFWCRIPTTTCAITGFFGMDQLDGGCRPRSTSTRRPSWKSRAFCRHGSISKTGPVTSTLCCPWRLNSASAPLERTQAQLFRATGLRARGDAWPEGGYSGEVRLIRDGTEIDRITAETRIAR